jgi:hypothetical protein
MRFRPLDPKLDWPFFDPGFPAPPDSLGQIRPLTEDSAAKLWGDYINADARHPMDLPDDSWPAQLMCAPTVASWQCEWNEGQGTVFAEWLKTMVPWKDPEPVIFTWSRSDSIETTWGVFCRCWRNFLFDDECPFLWSLIEPHAIGFTPRGEAHVGRRGLPMSLR